MPRSLLQVGSIDAAVARAAMQQQPAAAPSINWSSPFPCSAVRAQGDRLHLLASSSHAQLAMLRVLLPAGWQPVAIPP
jgi:hypothetical protein